MVPTLMTVPKLRETMKDSKSSYELAVDMYHKSENSVDTIGALGWLLLLLAICLGVIGFSQSAYELIAASVVGSLYSAFHVTACNAIAAFIRATRYRFVTENRAEQIEVYAQSRIAGD